MRSVGRTDICYDNAAAESFSATLKNEMYDCQTFDTRAHARFVVAEYVRHRERFTGTFRESRRKLDTAQPQPEDSQPSSDDLESAARTEDHSGNFYTLVAVHPVSRPMVSLDSQTVIPQ